MPKQAQHTDHKQGKQIQPAKPVQQGPAVQAESIDLFALQRAVLSPGMSAPGDILALQRMAGNRAVSRLIQTKLTVGAARDRYEQEADRVAEQVMSAQPQAANRKPQAVQRQEDEEEIQTKPLAATITPLVQRQEDEEEVQTKPFPSARPEDVRAGLQRQSEEKEIQTKSRVDKPFDAGPKIENRLSIGRGGGGPLPSDVRAYMEPRFGTDFSGVRVHTDTEAASMNKGLSAQAFTHGQDIYLGAGRYEPGTDAGKRLLAHELTHVVQQSGPAVQRSGRAGVRVSRCLAPTVQRAPLTADEIIEGLKTIKTFSDLLGGHTSLLDEYVETEMGPQGGDIEKVRGQEEDLRQGKLRQGMTLKDHITQVMRNYQEHFEKTGQDDVSNAMKLAAVLNEIARVLAAKFHIPHERSTIATELLTVFRSQLETGMKGGPSKDQTIASEAFNLAGVLVEKDPVGRYMHNKLALPYAAADVIKMATDAGKTNDGMLSMLIQLYQMQMGAYTRAQVEKGERKELQFGGGHFETQEMYGETSQAYFKSVVALAPDNEHVQWKPDDGGLVLTGEATAKLGKLGEEIQRQATEGGLTLQPATAELTAPQATYLGNIGRQEAGGIEGAKERLRQFFIDNDEEVLPGPKTGFAGMLERMRTTKKERDDQETIRQQQLANRKKARAMVKVQRCVELLKSDNAVWIMAFKPENVFQPPDSSTGITPPRPSHYLHAFEVSDYKDFALSNLVPGSTKSAKRLDPQFRGRGPDYGVQRFEKDIRASGNAPLLPSELARYGSIQVLKNPNNLGSLAKNASYGDYHFILDKTQIQGRSLFAVCKHQEVKDPLLLLDQMREYVGTRGVLKSLGNTGEMKTTEVEFHTYGPIPYTPQYIKKVVLKPGVKKATPSTGRALSGPEKMDLVAKVKVANPTVTDPMARGLLEATETTAQENEKERGLTALLATEADPPTGWGISIEES